MTTNKKNITLGLLLACVPGMGPLAQGVGPDKVHPAPAKVARVETELPISDIPSVGGFAGGRIEKNKVNYLETFPIENYVKLIEHPTFTDWDWRQGEQPGKWIEAATLTASRTKDQALEQKVRAMYKDVLASQAPDGYVGITSPAVRTPQKPLRGMDAYELYFLLHSLLTGYETWKDPKGLEAARRLGDYFVNTIGPGKAGFWPSDSRPPQNIHKTLKGTLHSAIAGHSIHYSWEGTLLIDPMMRLYELSGDKRYLTWCQWVVSNIDVWSGWNAYSNLDSVAAGTMPINAIQPYVHAHTFQMNFLGLLRMYQATGDPSYLRKVEGAWDDIAKRQMYITGSVSVGEHYERDYVKPLNGEMMETCAAMSWMQLSEYLLELTGNTKYADVMEKVWWNQVFAAQTIDGDANRYFTPPDGVEPRGDFRDPDCCSSSGERLLSMLPDFIYNQGKGTIYINQFVPSTVNMAGASLTQATDYPTGTQDIISVDPKKEHSFTLAIRIPAWCKAPRVLVNGEAQPAPQPGRYLDLTRTWKKGDKVTLEFPMQLAWVRHEHYLNTSNKKPYKTSPDPDAPYALVRGPLVYAVDNIWYTGDPAGEPKDMMNDVRYVLVEPASFKEVAHPEADLLGPGYVVPLKTRDGKALQMAVYPFANVGKWYKDPDHKPARDSAAYSYGIWLKGVASPPGAADAAPPGYYTPVGGAPAGLLLPKILDDNMVLQQGQPLPIWGMAGPGKTVQVRFGTQTKTAVADGAGHWQVILDPLTASDQPREMTIGPVDGSAVTRLANILVGEVWLCSGQSNMEYSMRKNSKFEDAPRYPAPKGELDKADNPDIRIFLVRQDIYKPNTPHMWDTAAGRALRDFSAAGYFFGKELYKQLHVPIGLIDASVSGSNIGPWLPAIAKGTAGGDVDTTGTAGKFYLDMIAPLAPFGLKGFLWYQGETNTFLNETLQYTRKMALLINSWRQLWAGPVPSLHADLPFYFVQLPPFYYSQSKGGLPHTEETLPGFREAQTLALTIPHTGMVVTTDLVDSPNDLHPAYKWEIGRRLALWALANDYGKKDLVYSGPFYQGMRVRKKDVILTFTHTGGLVSGNGQPLTWFTIADKGAGKDAGQGLHFVPAHAVIKGDEVIVSAKGVTSPAAVRFGWNEGARPNLFNREGLPASPFRTDNPYAGTAISGVRAQDASARIPSPATETQFLSGTGENHTVNWQFFCTAGRQSGKWTTIPVPSNWELQGFGKYNYGLDKDSIKGKEEGLYKYAFRVPAGWKDKTVRIVFDGSMTDTKVRINGRSAGPIHQGAFYRFSYDITGSLHYGRDNLLEVAVDKMSANRSVNNAERRGDFWVFGGIFRPVYLQAFPKEHIAHVAVDGGADGRFRADLQLEGVRQADRVSGQVYTLDGAAVGEPFSVKIGGPDKTAGPDKEGAPDTLARLETTIDHPSLWTPESPNLYKVVFTLSAGGSAVHQVTQRFGFRTIELRERDGIYVNGVKVKFKGVCRHSFWPSSGRTTSMELSIMDVGLMKDMNMNAVRMSHYPPDDHFLDVCDSMGLFVLDELTGWHHAYDTEVGSKLVKEMIEKDVNHPSIVLWDNGNEGGFNFDLDPLFDRLDIQHRPLIHPWAVFRHTDTQHYINYDYGNGTHGHGHEVTFPTEFLHGLYDGGGGAGLGDYWEAMWNNPLSAGGFIWDFSDEAVVRTDRDGELDTDGDHAPDGVLGPYREKEGSYYAIREVWASIHIAHREITPAFDGQLTLENRFFYTNLKDCHFTWKLRRTDGPYPEAGGAQPLDVQGAAQAPDIAPGAKGILALALPAGWQNEDVLYVTATDPHGREIYTWSWPVSLPERTARKLLGGDSTSAGPFAEGAVPAGPAARAIRLDSTDTAYTVSVKNIRLSFSRKTGRLVEAANDKGIIPLRNGPVLSDGVEGFAGISARYREGDLELHATYTKSSDLQGLVWTIYPSGRLRMDVRYFPAAYNTDLIGVDFSYPESTVKSVRWMGDGPYRVWKDRMAGVTLGVWEKAYNNTVTGQGNVVYPEFKGYYSNLHWVRLSTSGQPLTIICASEDVFLRLFTPAPPAHPYNTMPPFPGGDISFMHGIPAIGTKSQKAETMGPMGQKNMYYDYGKDKAYAKQLTLYFDFSGN